MEVSTDSNEYETRISTYKRKDAMRDGSFCFRAANARCNDRRSFVLLLCLYCYCTFVINPPLTAMSSPPPVHPRRPKPKRLSLSLPLSPSPAPSPARPRPPGPRRPSLLALITQPPAAYPPPAPPSPSPSSSSPAASTSTTPTTSPPLPPTFALAAPTAYPFRQTEPYQDGPVQALPGIWLGAEESVSRWDVWATNATGNRVRVMNVAQEVEDPFDPGLSRVSGWSAPSGLPEEMPSRKLKLKAYPAAVAGDGARPIPHVEYCHARWSHGELGLGDLPEDACLTDVLYPRAPESSERPWRFWETIRWMEEGRQRGIPILIQ